MYEDDFRRRTNLHRSGRAVEKPKKKGLGITGVQMAVCGLCILTAVIVRLAGGSALVSVRSGVKNALTKPVTASQVSAVFAQIKTALPNVSGVFDSAASGGVSSGGSSAAGSSAVSGASSAGTSSGAPSSSGKPA